MISPYTTKVSQFIFVISHVPIPLPKDVPRKQQEILGGVQEETSKDTKREQESRGGKEEKEAWQSERIDFISCTHTDVYNIINPAIRKIQERREARQGNRQEKKDIRKTARETQGFNVVHNRKKDTRLSSTPYSTIR